MKTTCQPAGPKRLPAATMTGVWFMILFLWLVALALPGAAAEKNTTATPKEPAK